MKAKDGFVMRTVVDENIIMPIDDNINQFEGAVVLNEVSAFIWSKLQQPITQKELLEAIINEFDVSEERAEKDLVVLLGKLQEFGLIEI